MAASGDRAARGHHTGIGVLIRDLRRELGWSQARLADRLCEVAEHATVTRDEVKRWESGKRCPGPFWLRHLATALEVPLAVLEEARMERRGFLTDVVGVTVAPLVAADLIRDGFTAALRNQGPDLDAWQDKVTTYGRDYMSTGAAEIQRRLAGDLLILRQQLGRPEAWRVAAKLMTLYGKTFPGADGARAVGWYQMAISAADRSADDATRVWVRGRAAIALGYEGAVLPVARGFARAARAIGADRPSLGLLNAIMGEAHVAAIRGDANGALRLVEAGRRVFDVAGSDDAEQSDYAVPWWRMNVFISLLAARLGNERVAAAAQDEAFRCLPSTMPRFRTHLEMHRGLMLARAGDAAGGVEHARAALAALPPDKHSLTLRLLMREIEQATG
jgi:transcriptional regulator with XRE-family HTH domain